jgi:hypothetical protein
MEISHVYSIVIKEQEEVIWRHKYMQYFKTISVIKVMMVKNLIFLHWE